MGFFSKFERRVESGVEGAADKMFDAPISPVQISKKAEKAMRREKMVGAGVQYAPTLYTVLVNPDDDRRLFGYYPTLAGETETYLAAKAASEGMMMDGQPLVRFIVDDELKHGKFDIIAEMVSAPIIEQLRQEEMQRYGLSGNSYARASQPEPAPYRAPEPSAYAPAPRYPEPAPQMREPEPTPYLAQQPYGEEQEPYTEQAPYAASAPYGEPEAAPAPAPVPTPAPAPQPAMQAAPAPEVQVPKTRMMPQQERPQGRQKSETARRIPHAQLIDTTTDRTYDLATARLVLGRGMNANIVLNDINASRQHAEIIYNPQGYWTITDLGSMNGTKVNGNLISQHVLNNGDRITLGVTSFVFAQA